MEFDSVREMTGILLKIRELSGKRSCQENLHKTVYCKLNISVLTGIQLESVVSQMLNIWFRIMYCCIPTPACDGRTNGHHLTA